LPLLTVDPVRLKKARFLQMESFSMRNHHGKGSLLILFCFL
jgi:hypothetical protein